MRTFQKKYRRCSIITSIVKFLYAIVLMIAFASWGSSKIASWCMVVFAGVVLGIVWHFLEKRKAKLRKAVRHMSRGAKAIRTGAEIAKVATKFV